MESNYFDCQCGSAEHTLRFSLETWEDEDVSGEICVQVHLRQHYKWYQRIYMAIRYIFGYQSKYGMYDCTLLQQEEYARLRELLDRSEKLIAERPGIRN